MCMYRMMSTKRLLKKKKKSLSGMLGGIFKLQTADLGFPDTN